MFALRKGLATFTVCHDCKSVHTCQKCDKPLVLHEKLKKIFVCHNCKKEEEAETKCKNCQSWNLIPLGFGQEAVYEEIKKDFPNRKVILFCTASFLSIPRKDLGALIIEKESSPAWEAISSSIENKTFAEILTQELNIKIIFADTLLSLKTVERHNQGELNELLPLKFRLTQMPEIIKQEDTSILEVTTFRMIQQSLTRQAFFFFKKNNFAIGKIFFYFLVNRLLAETEGN